MVISAGKVRKTVTFDPEVYEYLQKIAVEREKEEKGRVFVSDVIDKLAKDDMKIRKAFGKKK